MKKIVIGFALLTLSLTFNACDNLELAPEDYYASGSFWKTSTQVDGAMVGLHNKLRSYQFTLFNLGELRGGTLRTGTSFTGSASLELTDISGKKITLPTVDFNRESATQINISNYKPGIYLLKMITPEKTYTRKIAIQ